MRSVTKRDRDEKGLQLQFMWEYKYNRKYRIAKKNSTCNTSTPGALRTQEGMWLGSAYSR